MADPLMWPFRRNKMRPQIPSFRDPPPPRVIFKVETPPAAIEVEEIDTKDMSSTGIFRVFKKWKGEE
jgi:hypothetical protein